MLAKLIRHEFKATARGIFALYAALLLLGLLQCAGLWWEQPLLIGFSTLVVSVLSVALIVVTVVYVVRRFSESMFGSQGYLTLALPVKSGALIFAKSLVASFWLVVSVLAVTGMQLLFVGVAAGRGELDIVAAMDETFSQMGYPPFAVFQRMLPLLFFSFLLEFFFLVALIYFSVALANTGRFQSHHVLAGFAVFFGVYILFLAAGALLGFLLPLGIRYDLAGVSFVFDATDASLMREGIVQVGLGSYLLEAVLIAAFYFGTARLVERHVSLK